jgi:uncharacterized membrane protein
MTTRTATPAGSKRSWPVPAALIALVVVPVIAGVLRLVQLSGGAATMPPNPRFDASPLPVVVHIVSAIVFALVGAFQFVPRLRRRRAWHRRAGRVVVVAGLGVALSALWMIRSFAIALVAGTQVFTLGLGGAIFGTGDLAQAVMIVAAWGINLAVAEWVIRRPTRRRPAPRRPELSPGRARAGALS